MTMDTGKRQTLRKIFDKAVHFLLVIAGSCALVFAPPPSTWHPTWWVMFFVITWAVYAHFTNLISSPALQDRVHLFSTGVLALLFAGLVIFDPLFLGI